ncbi:ATP-binding protein [Parapedobacter sp. 10938]|uniref:ATP-binding protein n=1 Tax=Parapedobacter flavus TaxID=3110225 RepID=UPI002DB8F544|nr:ATP-binding protein [Parapedobacter sp. 10938]MEC3881930.1 ATP-binding protein [Parapedobacter sp. 10938]
MNKLYVITGGPGVGKTTLLSALSADGIAIVPEVARAIIKQQLAIGGDALPWKNKERYIDLMLATSIQDYRRVVEEQMQRTHLFDRSVIDAVIAERLNAPFPGNFISAFKPNHHPLVTH